MALVSFEAIIFAFNKAENFKSIKGGKDMTSKNWLILPLLLWLLNFFVTVVQHVHTGPGHVIPTPLQKLAFLWSVQSLGEDGAWTFATWFLIGTGFVSVLLTIPMFQTDQQAKKLD